MSTTYPRSAPIHRFRAGSFERSHHRGIDSPTSLSPSSSYIDLSRISSPNSAAASSRTRPGWTDRPCTTAHDTPTSNFGFEPKAGVGSHARAKLSSSLQQPGLLRQALQTQLAQTSSSRSARKQHGDLGERLRTNLAASDTHASSPGWQAAKKLAQNKVLLHPLVRKAHIIAATVHSSTDESVQLQTMRHLEESALIVAQLGLDATAVAAALLHEVLDDGQLSADVLRRVTSGEVCSIVMGVAKASRTVALYGSTGELQTQDNTEKLLAVLVALGDARVMLIKLAGRLQHARHMQQMSAAQRKQFLLVTERLFIPVANRLGIWAIKAEIEDLCFKASEAHTWRNLKAAVDRMLQSAQGTIAEFSHDALRELRGADIAVEDVEGRPKSLRSICSKLQRKGDGTVAGLADVHDVLAVRIIVRNKADCYQAMRQLAQRWPAMPGREKNYIHSPKPNGYRSLHNVLVSDSGMPIEVQIRTPAMHWNAEYGIASHWAYKEGTGGAPHGAGCSAGEDVLAQTHAQLVAWARMVLKYGHGMHDHRSASSTGHLRAHSTLSGVTHALMASTAHAEMDNADLPAGRGAQRRPVARTHSCCGSLEAGGARRGERRRSFEDYVASSVQPPALQNVLVPVTWAGGAVVCAIDAVLGASSVDKLLRSSALLAGVSCARVLVNGCPALGPTQPLTMGDCVEIVPQGQRAAAAASVPPRRYLDSAPTPLATLRCDMMRELCVAS